MPDASGRIRPVSIPRVPWHDGELTDQDLGRIAAAECTDPYCTRIDGKCVGYHCPHCGDPCSSMGHAGCQITAGEEAA